MDINGWRLFFRDLKVEGKPVSEVIAQEIGPKIQSGSFTITDVTNLLDKIPVKLGGKNTVRLSDIMPTRCIADLTELCENADV